MDKEISPELRKVRRFGRIARGFCVAFGLYYAAVLGLVVYAMVFGGQFKFNFGAFSVRADELTPVLVAWAAVLLASMAIPGWIGFRRMYALFDNLRQGRIYTLENVRHIRVLGILGIVLPFVLGAVEVISLEIWKAGLAPTGVLKDGKLLFGWPASFTPFIWPSLLILASWIMENGRQLRDEAERMRRDAELTI